MEHEILELCLSYMRLPDLARAACLDRNRRSCVATVIRQCKSTLVIEAVTASAEHSSERKHIAAVEYLTKQFAPHELQQLAEKFASISDVPQECCTTLVKQGLRISYAQMVAAARAGARRVHTWAHIQEVLGIDTDVPEADWQLIRGYVDRSWWYDLRLESFEELQPALLEELLFLAVSVHEDAAQKLLHLIRDPKGPSPYEYMRYNILSTAQQQRLQQAVLQLPHKTAQQLMCIASQHGYGKVLAWFEAWPALPQPQQEAVAAVIRQAAQQGKLDTIVGLLKCRTARQLTVEQVTEVMDTAVQHGQHNSVAVLALYYEAAAVKPSKVCEWLLALMKGGSCAAVKALCNMHAAAQVDAGAAAGLLNAALHAVQQHKPCAAQGVVDLQAVQQQLDAAMAATLCMAAVKHCESEAVVRVCRLSIAQEFSTATVYEMLEAAIQPSCCSSSILAELAMLPAAQRIQPEQLAPCMAALLQVKQHSAANTLWSFPTAQQMQAAQAAAVIKAALASNCLPHLTMPSTVDVTAPEVTVDLFNTALQQQCTPKWFEKSVQWLVDYTGINEDNQRVFIKVLQLALHLRHLSGLTLLCAQPAAAQLAPGAVLGVLQHEMQQQLQQREQQQQEPAQQRQQQLIMARAVRVLVGLCNSLPQGQQHWHEEAVRSMLEVAVRLDSLKLLNQLVQLKAARSLEEASHDQLIRAAKQQNVQGTVLAFVMRSWR